MRRDRAAYRNIRFHDASTGASIGSFYQNSSITEENLIWILNDVLLLVDEGDSWTIQHRATGRTVTPVKQPRSIRVTDEPWVARLCSHSVSSGDGFRDGARARDGKCVVSAQVNLGAQWDDWV
ncbi:hypothetical protein RJZ57_001487 [Blastomyces gilchristii]